MLENKGFRNFAKILAKIKMRKFERLLYPQLIRFLRCRNFDTFLAEKKIFLCIFKLGLDFLADNKYTTFSG